MKKKLKKFLEILLFIVACFFINECQYIDIDELPNDILVLVFILSIISGIFIYKEIYSFGLLVMTKFKNMDINVRKKLKKSIIKMLKSILIIMLVVVVIMYFEGNLKYFGLKKATEELVTIFILPIVGWFVVLKVCRQLFSEIGKAHRILKQIDKDDIAFEKEYYREILSETSPLVLGYIDSFDIDKNKLIAEIIYLERKGLIKISNNKLVTLPSSSKEILEYEKRILQKIQNGKIKYTKSYFADLRDLVAVEVEKQSLVKMNKGKKNKKTENTWIDNFSWKIKLTLFLLVIFMLNFVKYLPLKFALFIWSFIMFSVIIYLWWFSYKEAKGNKFYKRTPKGKEINKKLEGLKEYLKDYSLLSEREAKEIELWEDYLIYSVMFGQNKKIVEEYEKYIEVEEIYGE